MKKTKRTKKTPSRLRAFFSSKRAVALLSAALAVLLLAGALLAIYIPAGAVVLRYESATMREDVYLYYTACMKYEYLVRYKGLNISDTQKGWMTVGADGRTYEDSFKEAIDEDICLRFIAAYLFDRSGLSLSEEDYADIDKLFTDLETYSYGESPYKMLNNIYGIRAKRVLKQVALYEKKYAALLTASFGEDGSAVLDEAYSEDLATFYEKYYYRYNVIYVSDERAEVNEPLREFLAGEVTEKDFTDLEKSYSDAKVTSGKYPNGIYLYAGGSYTAATTGLDEKLLATMSSLEKVGDIGETRNDADNGTYYVMRYALDEAPYLGTADWVKTAFADLPAAASVYVFRRDLAREFSSLTVTDAASKIFLWETVACREYNVLRSLAN